MISKVFRDRSDDVSGVGRTTWLFFNGWLLDDGTSIQLIQFNPRWVQCQFLPLQFSNTIGILLEYLGGPPPEHSRLFLLDLKCPNHCGISTPTSQNFAPPFLLLASSSPPPLWRTPAWQSWHRTYRDQRPPEWSFMRRKATPPPRFHFGVSKRHNNTWIRGKRDRRNQMAWKTFGPYYLSPSPQVVECHWRCFTANEAPSPPFLVLADGAHNPASAKTLGEYTHPYPLSSNPIYSKRARITQRKRIFINFNNLYPITFLLSSKIPLQTLSPMFPPGIPISTIEFGETVVSMTISVGLLRCTPPDGMP